MSDFGKIEWETSDFKNTGKIVQKTRNSREMSGKQRGKTPLVRLLWCAAAPGLKPLRLPRARSPGMGEGGDWWS